MTLTIARGTRFIPTPVGNTYLRTHYRDKRTVHPHACGEHQRADANAEADAGSSPRLWGTREWRSLIGSEVRFIPTPVGNTHS